MKNLHLILLLFTGTILMILTMRWHGKPLTETPSTKTGILSLEFSKTKHRSEEITNIWESAGLQNHAVTNTHIDFIFILFYSLFLFAANQFIAVKQVSMLKNVSQVVAFFGLTAGLLDIIENYYLLKMLDFNISNPEAFITWWLAALKFILAGIAVVWILLNLLFIIIKPKT